MKNSLHQFAVNQMDARIRELYIADMQEARYHVQLRQSRDTYGALRAREARSGR